MKWFIKNWAKIGGLIAIVIILSIILSNTKLTEIESLLWIHFAFLQLHQFEEYVFPGKFKEFYNENIFGQNKITRFALNDNGIIIVNVILAWTAYLSSAILSEKFICLAIGLILITIVNGIMHTTLFFVKKRYNPGFITGLFLFIPFGLFIFLRLVKNITIENLVIGILIFIIGTVLIPLSILIGNKI